jgi:hypothetical protein
MDNNIIDWIQDWYNDQCDGDWEHSYGVKICTVDNPGWLIEIDLIFTELENLELPYQLIETDENDWYGFMIKEKKFKGSGDPSKLNLLLNKFKSIAENEL